MSRPDPERLTSTFPSALSGLPIDSVRAKGVSRVRTRFLSIPDVPLSRTVFDFFGGDRGLIETPRTFCATKPWLEIRLKAQNRIQSVTKPTHRAALQELERLKYPDVLDRRPPAR